jgi:hypothetical protein
VPKKPPSNPLTDVRSDDGVICLGDFYAVPALGQFIYMPTREIWSADNINDILPALPAGYKRNGKQVMLRPAAWLRKYSRVEQMTWAPGLPEIIYDRLLFDGGWQEHQGARCLNTYRPPLPIAGDASKATPWLKHVRLLYPEEAEEILDWMAQRVQHPEQKINHALGLGGGQGIGKDWLLHALKRAVGSWNFQEVSPPDLLERNNPFVKAVVLRMNEAHDLGDGGRIDRYALYERTKIYAAAPPDVLPCVDKYIRRHYVPNAVGLIITSNHKTDGVYLPSDDRRHLMAWSDCKKEQFSKEFWNEKWRWMLTGGADHVAAYLIQRDISAFDPCAVPRQTTAFFEIVNANQAPEDHALADALDELDRPEISSMHALLATPRGAALEWMTSKPRALPHRMERCGYVAVRNPDNEKGIWRINNQRQMLYGRTDLTPEKRLEAAKKFALKMTKATGNG